MSAEGELKLSMTVDFPATIPERETIKHFWGKMIANSCKQTKCTSYQLFASQLQTHPSLPYFVIIEITPETYFLQHPGEQASSIKGSRETLGFPLAQTVKNLPAMQETQVRSLCWKDPLVKGMATHSSVLAWRIPRTGEPGGLPSMGSHRVGHDWSDLVAAAADQYQGFPGSSAVKNPPAMQES